jgi:hypothetical protein
MRARPTMLRKTCPFCGGPSFAEAKLPVASNLPTVEYNLDDLGALVENQSLSMLLALVELLPYKNFVCRKCHGEFRMESRTGKELVRSMLATMKPVIPETRKTRQKPGPAAAPIPAPSHKPLEPPTPAPKEEWEAESLDALFDYSIDAAKK